MAAARVRGAPIGRASCPRIPSVHAPLRIVNENREITPAGHAALPPRRPRPREAPPASSTPRSYATGGISSRPHKRRKDPRKRDPRAVVGRARGLREARDRVSARRRGRWWVGHPRSRLGVGLGYRSLTIPPAQPSRLSMLGRFVLREEKKGVRGSPRAGVRCSRSSAPWRSLSSLLNGSPFFQSPGSRS